jgi:hypothetical protein
MHEFSTPAVKLNVHYRMCSLSPSWWTPEVVVAITSTTLYLAFLLTQTGRAPNILFFFSTNMTITHIYIFSTYSANLHFKGTKPTFVKTRVDFQFIMFAWLILKKRRKEKVTWNQHLGWKHDVFPFHMPLNCGYTWHHINKTAGNPIFSIWHTNIDI